jgi:hypothetical protein
VDIEQKVIRNRLAQSKWAKKNPIARKAIMRRYYDSSKGIYIHIKKRCIGKDIYLLSRDEFIEWYDKQPKSCVYCKIPENLVVNIKNNKMKNCKRLTIDRIVPSKGYKQDNMALACTTCNFVKNDIFSFDEMKIIGKVVEEKWRNENENC